MRHTSVRRLQAPGGVRDRVQAWQRENSSTMTKGNPDDAATEPTDVAFKGDEESVTEEDRIRIKMRVKKINSPMTKPVLRSNTAARTPADDATRLNLPPKKRVVSDDNWRKRNAREKSSRTVSPKASKFPAPIALPADFVRRSGPNPSVPNKIKAWASKIEVPSAPPPPSCASSISMPMSASCEGAAVSDGEDTSSQTTAKHVLNPVAVGDDGIGAKVLKQSPPHTSESVQRPRIRADIAGTWRTRGKTMPGHGRDHSPSDRIEVIVEPPRTTSSHREAGPDRIQVTEYPESVMDTPTKRPGSKRRSAGKVGPKTFYPATSRPGDGLSCVTGDKTSNPGSVCNQGSDVASSVANKSLADIPGDIPFGHSAFSELDLPMNKIRPKRAKVDRNSSLKSVPNVFKKVVEEGKKIIHDINHPRRQPVPSNPPSIEKWLNNTVDPFLDKSTAASPTSLKNRPADTQLPEQTRVRRRSSHDAINSHHAALHPDSPGNQENTPPPAECTEPVVQKEQMKKARTPTLGGLKRSRATRNSASPLRSGSRRPFLGVLKEAFQGESSGHTTQPKSYQSQEQRKLDGYDHTSDSYHSSDYTSTTTGINDTPPPTDDGQTEQDTPKMTGPRLWPPTNGNHELSTIVSEDDSSALESSLSSDVTYSTLTQSTGLTRDSEAETPHDRPSGLKRRLTRHSDLVSVLSLPDNSGIPSGIKDSRSRPSLRKSRTSSVDVTAEELLREFIDDDNLYLRELKTMADGVVPVLLAHVVNGTNATELFGHKSLNWSADDGLSKSVVNMGVALEKLKNAHKKAPTSDIRRLANWAHGVVPIYNNYLSAWRLGFEDVIVNLAPAAGKPGDEDSLLNALPRNERGDIVDAEGERVAVSHLLKRPLFRVRQMAKFFKCVDAMVNTNDTHDLLQDFEDLQEKARRRHKEETARITDADAIDTDTTRTRDLRTLDAAVSVTIDSGRQVNAKDLFSLSLTHSNGQRLDCQVELVHRDCRSHPEDQGDLLIRETGDGRRTYLLFAPIPMPMVSARTGKGNLDMVLMVRGMCGGRSWHELLTLVADDEDQILDWLDILPLSPVPPNDPEPCHRQSTPARRPREPPVAEHDSLALSPKAPIANEVPAATPEIQRSLPLRYRPQRATVPPRLSPAASPERHEVGKKRDEGSEERSRPLSESMRPEPRSLWEGGANTGANAAPPPPPNRTPSRSPQRADRPAVCLHPPAESKGNERVKRRGSSPLKHEYLPSDSSSTSEAYSTEDSDSGSSDYEIEGVDIPETELGVSIKKGAPAAVSLLSGSECSLTPSNSASQAGLHGPKTAPEENAERFVASISRWSDKGTWKDISAPPCSIIVKAGLIEAYALRNRGHAKNDDGPILALDLTPLVLIRQSTALDLEIRSSVQPHCMLHQSHGGGNFRFRCHNAAECFNLYMSVHHARLNNRKFMELENEARFKSFGERPVPADNEGSTSSQRRSWFGRKNSYRGSVRAPSQSHDGASTTPSSTPSASSFLKRLTLAGNLSFNIARSSVDRRITRSRNNSLYTSGSSSSGGTPLRSPSVSVENSGDGAASPGSDSMRIRLHLLVAAAKWEDYGNCSLQIRRPPPGWHQALRADHGLEKRVTATTLPRKDADEARIVLDAVLGSGCFSPMGTRGIVCGVWEELRSPHGRPGSVPANGATGGNIKKWCFQFATAAEASWVLRLVHQEVVRA